MGGLLLFKKCWSKSSSRPFTACPHPQGGHARPPCCGRPPGNPDDGEYLPAHRVTHVNVETFFFLVYAAHICKAHMDLQLWIYQMVSHWQKFFTAWVWSRQGKVPPRQARSGGQRERKLQKKLSKAFTKGPSWAVSPPDKGCEKLGGWKTIQKTWLLCG
jgi:hypothetical protein